MKVFISWSTERSRVVANELAVWLRQVIQSAEPWVSTSIEKGVRGTAEIADALEASQVGIICLTPENLRSEWIHFEAGALAKMRGAHVCTLLVGVAETDVRRPLSDFQWTKAEKGEVFELVRTINEAAGKGGKPSLSEPDLASVFELNWPRLKEVFDKAIAQPIETPIHRPERELLEEALSLIRAVNTAQAQLTLELLETRPTIVAIIELAGVHDDFGDAFYRAASKYYRSTRLSTPERGVSTLSIVTKFSAAADDGQVIESLRAAIESLGPRIESVTSFVLPLGRAMNEISRGHLSGP
jgi:hypothetical protein